MKGCLKLTSMPSPGLDSQVQHLNGLNEHVGGAQCYYIPDASPISSTAEASCVTNDASTTPIRIQTQTHRKCVAFCAKGSETVYTADEWDRTPTEPARKLSYQDLLELKEIQRSLPHANQPEDIVTGRPGKQFLSAVPIVLLPLLSSGASANGGDRSEDTGATQEDTAKKQCYFSDASGRTNNGHVNGHTSGNGIGWGPPSLIRQAQTQSTPVRPSFPFPPRPVPFSALASKPAYTSAPTPPSPVTQPWHMNFQPQSKTRSSPTSPPPPTSPTSPYPSSYSNRPSTTSPSVAYPYSNFHQQLSRTQNQPRTSWTPPPSLCHLMPATPIKPREKPKFEFLTLLDTGAGTGDSSGLPPPGGVNGVGNDEIATAKVGSDALLHPASNLPSGLIEIEKEMEGGPHRHHDKHDLEDHDQDHDFISVTSSPSSCPSLCTSSCPSSCSASEVDTDHEPEVETEGRYYSGLDRYGYAVRKGWAYGDENGVGKRLRPTSTSNNRSLSLSFPNSLDLHILNDEVEQDKSKVMVKKKPKKEKKKKFILVNDMEIELDDSASESESEVGEATSTNTSTTVETTTKTITEKATTTTTTSSNGGSPRHITAPLPVKSPLWGSQAPPSSSASLITPPTTPPSEQVSRYGSGTSMYNNKPLHSSPSPSTTSRGRMKAIQKMGSSTSRERSGSMGSDSGGGGGGGSSPNWSCNAITRLGSPVKLKSKMS